MLSLCLLRLKCINVYTVKKRIFPFGTSTNNTEQRIISTLILSALAYYNILKLLPNTYVIITLFGNGSFLERRYRAPFHNVLQCTHLSAFASKEGDYFIKTSLEKMTNEFGLLAVYCLWFNPVHVQNIFLDLV